MLMTVIQPGDWVSVLLYLDGHTRTSTVDADGGYVGCGAVAGGYAEITDVWAYSWQRPRRTCP